MYQMGIWGLRVAALTAALLIGVAPASAQHRGGGGHGGGGHVSGGHVSGGHVSGYHGGYSGYHSGYSGYRGGYGYGYGRGFYGWPGVGIGLYGYSGNYGYGYSSYPYYGYSSYPDNVIIDTAPTTSYYYDPSATTQVIPATPTSQEATVEVRVPEDAQVWFDGTLTQQGGADGLFSTPSLSMDRPFSYDVRARWNGPNGVVDQTRRVEVRGGQRTVVDFMRPQ